MKFHTLLETASRLPHQFQNYTSASTFHSLLETLQDSDIFRDFRSLINYSKVQLNTLNSSLFKNM